MSSLRSSERVICYFIVPIKSSQKWQWGKCLSLCPALQFLLLFSTFDMVRFIRLLQLRSGPLNVITEVFHYLWSNFVMQWFQCVVIEKGCCGCEEQEVRPHRRAEAGDKRSIRSFWYWRLRYSERCHSSPKDFPSSWRACQILSIECCHRCWRGRMTGPDSWRWTPVQNLSVTWCQCSSWLFWFIYHVQQLFKQYE
jgi:hypothetical protein